jgi:FHS family L-fucose permease-like MFS transporter
MKSFADKSSIGKELDAYRDSHVGLSEGQVDPDSRIGSISGPAGVNFKDIESGVREVGHQKI